MKHIDLVGTRSRFFLISGLAIVASLVLLAIPPALRPGIEFTSGTTMLVQFEQSVRQEDLRSVMTDLGHAEARIQSTSGSVEYLIRMSELEIPEGSFTEVTPEETVTPVGPAPVEPIATLKLGPADGSGEVALRRPSGDDACTFGDVVRRFPYATEGELLEPVQCPVPLDGASAVGGRGSGRGDQLGDRLTVTDHGCGQ